MILSANPSHAQEATTLSGLQPSDFVAEAGGKQVALYILKNKNGLEACITNYGWRVVSLMTPDKHGTPTDVVLGFANINDYFQSFSYFGALLGRYAGRIADSRFELDGTEYRLQAGFGRHCLHGGMGGFHMRVWDAVPIDGQTLELSLFSPDGEAGFPGNLQVKVIYTLTDDNALDIRYEAVIATVGGNANASWYAGINEKAVKLFAFVFSGFCAGVAGLIICSNIKSADANNAGLNTDLDGILAAVIGGTNLAGGKFSLTGSLVGALLIQTLTTTIYAFGVPPEVSLVVKALVVVLVCFLQSSVASDFFGALAGKRVNS